MTFIQVLNLIALPIFICLVLCIYGFPGIRLSILLLSSGASLAMYLISDATSQGYRASDAMLFMLPGRFYIVNGSIAYGLIMLGMVGIGKIKH